MLVLTNDQSYSNIDISKTENFDKNYSFHHEALIEESDKGWNYSQIDMNKYELRDDNLWWYKNSQKLHWTCAKELNYKLDLNTNYKIEWNQYSILPETNIKYCLIKVEKGK